MWFFQVLPCRVLAKSPSIQGTCGLCGLQTHEKVEKLEPMRWLFSSEVMRNSGQKQKNTTSHEIYDPVIFRSWTWALLEHPGMPWTYQPGDSRTSLLGWMRQTSGRATRVTHGPGQAVLDGLVNHRWHDRQILPLESAGFVASGFIEAQAGQISWKSLEIHWIYRHTFL